MISDARGGHVSPGTYTEEKDVTFSVKSLGITSLGLVGETLKGPAFQNIPVKDWTEYTDYFGGTSPEKYVGTGLPKYELPYVAKEYLKESNNLNVVRVLGLSGYENSKAYGIKAEVSGGTTIPVVVLRSKGDYEGATSGMTCEGKKQEKFREYVSAITISNYKGCEYDSNCSLIGKEYTIDTKGTVSTYTDGTKWVSDAKGREVGKFVITIKTINEDNPFGKDKTYNYNVSLDPTDREFIYKVFSIDPLLGSAPVYIESVYDYAYDELIQKTDSGKTVTLKAFSGLESSGTSGESNYEDYTDYKESYRCAITPWVVSEVKGATASAITVNKLFRFYTISDGNAANFQVKISIQKIRPEEGLFDICVRDFYDNDISPVVLERFSNVSMVEGSPNYIGLKIGTFDGEYEVKSKFITVEISKEDGVESCVPCGFLGYPVPSYGVGKLEMKYNTLFDSTIKPKRQYFGLNNKVLDEDVLTYKGKTNYFYEPSETPKRLSNGFHLDAILSMPGKSMKSGSTETNSLSGAMIYVDSVGFSAGSFTTVDDVQIKGKQMSLPRILTEEYMKDTIYADINTRKFTVYPYGGFDGWDIYRESRTNTDKYKATKYAIVDGCPFDYVNPDNVTDPMADLGLPGTAITSDYYAYLAGYKQFANPEDVDINVFATPGITFRNNVLLVEDALDMVEDSEDGRNGDALYIIDAPQDGIANDIVNDLENSEIDSSYAATYWPWVKYFDSDANKYIMLPPTKDVVRNIAETDNKANPWFAPAGTRRGKMNVTRAEQKTKLLDEDELYANRINPIKTFAKDGVLVWGNKTLYSKETPLNRINVRRLMIRVKKLVIEASRNMIFENMDNSLEKQFRSLVEPILSDVKDKRGIIDYRIMVENTPETRDQHMLPARILIKPTQALEYISISFVVYPESVQFDEN